VNTARVSTGAQASIAAVAGRPLAMSRCNVASAYRRPGTACIVTTLPSTTRLYSASCSDARSGEEGRELLMPRLKPLNLAQPLLQPGPTEASLLQRLDSSSRAAFSLASIHVQITANNDMSRILGHLTEEGSRRRPFGIECWPEGQRGVVEDQKAGLRFRR
jgi:hypothetical protein